MHRLEVPSIDRKHTALQIKAAIESIADKVQPIGRCITKERAGRQDINDDRGGSDEESDSGSTPPTENSSGIKAPPYTVNEAVVCDLAKLYKEVPVYASGELRETFRLSVTRAGCKYDADVRLKDSYFKPGSKEEDVLRMLFDGAAISGFGDVRSQETKVDAGVRNAREIPASEFTVSPSLIDAISEIWSKHFEPRDVTVAPYKMHLYGQGGLFKALRDTPETGLVGTFLVGIGDSTNDLNLELALRDPEAFHSHWTASQVAFSANPGQWVAFYPDVPHRVLKLKSGYRAVIAFKVFRRAVSPEEGNALVTAVESESLQMERVIGLTNKLNAPFGLLLERKYYMGIEKLTGLDAVVYKALLARDGCTVHLLPVVIRWSAECERESTTIHCTAPVFPLTAAHVDALTREIAYGFHKTDPTVDPLVSDDESLAWLKRVSRPKNGVVPFFATDVADTTVTWSHTEESEVEFVGNESRPWSQDSVYLSYAVVLLPNEK
ncbi:hypothetical protein FA95DRAFT_925238 [Auriscalpium vulgare]|uniref:Uncharacterized protein n=1 Tax=Auriscalpium vulgare TaxID=40419 RepID=A0ACB8S058_9AGAM|nr:hypothetical protein FA95DRAFT_925238 [Auriscalpium vulgare]